MIPVKTITVYKSQGAEKSLFFETSSILKDKKTNEYYASNPKPLSAKDLLIFNKASVYGNKALKYIPAPFFNLIFANFHELEMLGISEETLQMVWWSEPTKKHLFFPKGYSIKSQEYHIPKLIWVFDKGSIYVGALFDAQIRLETPVYFSPFPNVYDSMKVCQGTMKFNLKGATMIEEAKKNIEHSFYMSDFNSFHKNPFSKLTNNKGFGVMEKRQLKEEELLSADQTIQDLCHSL